MQDILTSIKTWLPDAADYLVYGAIAIVTLIGVFKCLVPLWNTTGSLRRAIGRLQDDAGKTGGERPVWQEPRFVGKRLKGSWLRFLQNAEQLDRRGLPCNVEDYINDDTVTHGPGNAQLAELIPSLLTSLGILGTFMGMTRGLSGLDVTSTDSMMTGIQTLLTGMQFAFGTSVAGVACSLVFNMLNRIAQGSSYRAIDDFVESFTQLAMQRPLDNDVQLICQNQDRNHLLGSVTDTITTQMTSSIERAIGRAMQPVAQSMDNFLIGATRGQVEGVGMIVNSFVDRMNASLNNQFLVLGQTMSEVNARQQVSIDRLDQSLACAANIVSDVDRLHTVSGDIINHFEHYVAELGKANRRDERFEQNTTELLDKLHQASDMQSTTLARLRAAQDDLSRTMAQFTQTGRDTVESMGRMSAAAADQLTGVNQTMREAGDSLSRSYQTFVQDVVEGLSRALGMFDENMQGMVAALTEQVDRMQASGTDGVTAAQMSELQRTVAAMKESLENAAAAIASGRED